MQRENLLNIQSESLNTVELVIGEKAVSSLLDPDFLIAWDALYNSCPWATVYQGKEFVSTWYKIYHQKYLPVIVKEVNEHRLIGLFTLARDKNGLIIGAGAGQAEYQVWLATESNGERFIKNALYKIQKQFPGSDVQFKFIPDQTPLKWAETDPRWKKLCLLQVYQQPLMILDDASISEELRKKKRRIKTNKLKKHGDLNFERITNFQTFLSVFDELAAQFDFRKGALYNITPFQSDPLRKEFLLALFKQNFLHATVLKSGNEVVASNVGAISERSLHLQGINTHSPCYSRYSPGILHLLMLGKLLLQEGFEIIDLTPGGNTYKEALATNHLLTYELLVGGSLSFYIKKVIKIISHSLLRNKQKILGCFHKMGIQSNHLKNGVRRFLIVKERVRRIREHGPSFLLREMISSLTTSKKQKIYKIEDNSEEYYFSIKKNNLRDLLNYQPKSLKLTKWEFLVKAMEKLEKGHNVYTMSENNRLQVCVWLTEDKDDCPIQNTKQEFTMPDGSAILYDFYSHPEAREKLKAFIVTVARELSKSRNVGTYAVISNGDRTLRKTLREITLPLISRIDVEDHKDRNVAV